MGKPRIATGARPDRTQVTLKSKRNELIRSGQATRRDGSLGRKVQSATAQADATVEQLCSMTAKARRTALRKHRVLMRKWKVYRDSMPDHPTIPSKVSALTLESGAAADFRERIDGNRAMDPHFVVGMSRQLPMAEMPKAVLVAIRSGNKTEYRSVYSVTGRP